MIPSSIDSARAYFLPETTSPDEISPNQRLLPLEARVTADDHLEIGGCDVVTLVRRYGSPLFIVDEQSFRLSCRLIRDSLAKHYPGESQPLYASKAWSTTALVRLAHIEGMGIEVVSGGELLTALKAGVTGSKIYFHGNNKSDREIEKGIEAGCTIVVESMAEVEDVRRVAERLGGGSRRPKIMLRLTPGIECHTHEYIRTGSLDTKFGFSPSEVESTFRALSSLRDLETIGIHAHIGSQIFEMDAHRDLAGVMVKWLADGRALGLPLTELNMGGGLGIRYQPSDDPPHLKTWTETIAKSVIAACHEHKTPLPKLLCEPGRAIVGSSTVTAYTVGHRKEIPGVRTYVAIDGGMSDNPRPITYQAIYTALLANKISAPFVEHVTVAGKHCESGDFLIKHAHLPRSQSGDILVVLGTGAYNYSMASNYNRLPRPCAVLVNAGQAEIILAREEDADLLRLDRLPAHLA